MAVDIVCDKCQKSIDKNFVQIESYYYSLDERGMPEYCQSGDQIILCDKCYSDFMKQLS